MSVGKLVRMYRESNLYLGPRSVWPLPHHRLPCHCHSHCCCRHHHLDRHTSLVSVGSLRLCPQKETQIRRSPLQPLELFVECRCLYPSAAFSTASPWRAASGWAGSPRLRGRCSRSTPPNQRPTGEPGNKVNVSKTYIFTLMQFVFHIQIYKK